MHPMPLPKENVMKVVQEMKKSSPKRNFKQSVELIVRLRDVDVKKSEGRIAETIELPNPIEKPIKGCVIATGDLAVRAKAAGVDLILGREDLDKLSKDKKAAKKTANNYDFFIAEAPLMPLVGKTIGAFLGPRGKMPTPVPPSAPIEEIIKRHRKLVRIRVRDHPVIQCRVGTEDMSDEKIVENVQTVIGVVEAKLERGARNIASVALKTAMGAPIKIAMAKE